MSNSPVLSNPWTWSVVCGVALLATLAARAREWLPGEAVCKPLASTAFILAAVFHGAAATGYGRAVLVALGLSWLGDAFLISRGRRFFLMGLAAFLLGHVTYCVAFVVRGIDVLWAAAAALPLALIGARVLAWLGPHVPPRMRLPVRAYVTVITVMVTLAIGAFGGGSSRPWVFPAAATMFWCSDLAVARDRFIAPGFINRLWGLPLYYAAQIAFAWSVTV